MPQLRVMQIVPAVLTDKMDDLKGMVDLSATFCDHVQIDFMDGSFVPSRSVNPSRMAEIQSKIGMEAHMMVAEPDDFETLAKAGFKQVIFHFEATNTHLALVEQIRSLGMLAGLAVNPDTLLDEFYGLVKHVDTILIMTVNPGYYGSAYQPDALAKGIELRARLSSAPTLAPSIGVDGGVSANNIREIAAAGMDFACVGSAIFSQEDPPAAYESLVRLASS